jgi:hypothetical protein
MNHPKDVGFRPEHRERPQPKRPPGGPWRKAHPDRRAAWCGYFCRCGCGQRCACGRGDGLSPSNHGLVLAPVHPCPKSPVTQRAPVTCAYPFCVLALGHRGKHHPIPEHQQETKPDGG